MYKTLKPALIAAAALIGVAVPAGAQEISAIKDGIHVIQGKGGNIGVSAGADGVFMIDDQFAPATDADPRPRSKRVTDQPVRFLVNTHFHHGDHIPAGTRTSAKRGVLIFRP